ncbi:MAG TPA: hypothetical protein VM073_06520 [Usitatibacter sp.]|nr:hypothetical protein [Usitatibacter sp.]
MNTFKFSGLPSNAAVSSVVTLLVSAWFVAAGGAILTDQHSEGTIESARGAPVVSSGTIPDEARLTIVVEARRTRA